MRVWGEYCILSARVAAWSNISLLSTIRSIGLLKLAIRKQHNKVSRMMRDLESHSKSLLIWVNFLRSDFLCGLYLIVKFHFPQGLDGSLLNQQWWLWTFDTFQDRRCESWGYLLHGSASISNDLQWKEMRENQGAEREVGGVQENGSEMMHIIQKTRNTLRIK